MKKDAFIGIVTASVFKNLQNRGMNISVRQVYELTAYIIPSWVIQE
jgi:hypothetical protein